MHLFERVDFDMIVDHLALTHIIKSKAELAISKIKRLLELISLYSFTLYNMKGKDMVLSDFLSRLKHDNSHPHEIIPISFNMYNALYETYYRLEPQDQYLVQTWLQTKATGIMLPEAHSMEKTLGPRVLPEKQKPQIQAEQVVKIRPKLGRGKAGIRHKTPQPVVADITATESKSCKIPTIQNVTKDNTNFPVPEQLITNKTETVTRRKIQDKNREQPFYPDPIFRPPQMPPDNLRPNHPESESDTRPKIDIEFEENSPHQEGIISEIYQWTNKTYFQEPKDLESLINTCI